MRKAGKDRLTWGRFGTDMVRGLVVAGLMASLAMGVTAAPAGDDAAGNRTYPEVCVAHDMTAPMRDGVLIATDVYLPCTDGHPLAGRFPTLLDRTPYGKSYPQRSGMFFARHGYAVVVQDVRGTGNSQGVFYPYVTEAEDSYDAVEWAAAQPWSDGKVGMFGVSYDAATQLLLVHNDKLPTHLVAMSPGYASSSYYGDGAYAGGAFRSSHNLDYEMAFAVEQYDKSHATSGQMTPIKKANEAIDQLYWRIPLKPFKPLLDAGFPVLDDYMEHYTYDDYWAKLNNIPLYHKLNLPVLSYGGWYDLFDQGTVQNYEGAKNQTDGPSRAAAQLVMGPYEHANQSEQAQGMMSGMPMLFPRNSTFVSDELDLAWFDQHLKGEDVFRGVPSVRLYVPGAGFDRWIGADDFPVPGTRETRYYLHSSGKASIGNVDVGHLDYDGSLDTTPPRDDEPVDRYTYDPRHPVITIDGYDQHWAGGVNQETLMYQDHKDFLVYETPLLESDTAVLGPITVTLYASTSAKTTDFMVNLTDVNPAGHTTFIAEGARRGGIGDVSADPRDPESYSKVIPLVPGKVYQWEIAVWPTGRVFAKGHRIRVDVTSSDFPHFNRNLNVSPALTSGDVALAMQTIYHSGKYASFVTLPIVPMDDLKKMVINGPTPPGYPQHGDAIYHAIRNLPWQSATQGVVTERAGTPRWTVISQ